MSGRESGGGSGKIVLILILLAVGGYLLFRFFRQSADAPDSRLTRRESRVDTALRVAEEDSYPYGVLPLD